MDPATMMALMQGYGMLSQPTPPPAHMPQPQTNQGQQSSVSLGEMLFNRPTAAAQAPGQFNKAPQFPGVM